MRTALVALVGVLLVARAAADQTPIRDGGGATSVGTGVISGVLVSREPTPVPVRRALLKLTSSALQANQLSSTDEAGRFVFSGLPAGRFLLSATKTGYVGDNYGSAEPGGSGAPIALTNDQRVNITMALTRAATITGTVLLPAGTPTSSVRVSLYKQGLAGGERGLISANRDASASDDRGVYRISGLPPGEYFVAAVPSNLAFQEFRETDFSLTPPAAPRAIGLSSVFYPGVVDPGRADPIALSPGEERAGVDIPLQFVPTARVEGRFVSPDGQVLTNVNFSFADAVPVARLTLMSSPFPDGRFQLTGLTPGTYVLKARGALPDARPVSIGGRPPEPQLTLWARQELDINGRDLTDVVIPLVPGRTMSGRVVFEPGTRVPPADLSTVVVRLVDPVSRGPSVSTLYTFAKADGSFEMSGIAPGRYKLMLNFSINSPTLAGWSLKSAVVDGRDLLDQVLTLEADRDWRGMTITYTDRAAELSGLLVDANGRPAPEFFVVAFSTDQKFWTDGSRRVVRVRPAADGSFTMPGLPGGEYYVCGLTAVDLGQLGDPAFLQSLIPASFKISIAEGEKKKLDLKIGR